MRITDWPFLGSEARAAGLVNRYQLQTQYVPLYRNVYLRRGVELTAEHRAVAAWLWSARQATVAGTSAAALHGSSWIDASLPAELNQRSQHRTRGITLHGDELWDDEQCLVDGMTVTTPARTAFDLGRRRGRTVAVIRLDALLRATGVKAADVEALLERHPGVRGVVQLREVLTLLDAGAESPQETRTRLVIVDAGIPAPATQVHVFDGRLLVARLDMGWERWKVAVEFDGAQHWTDRRQRSRDIDRIAELEALGWTVVRVSGEMLRGRPWVVIERVRAALRAAGCPI